MSSVAVAWAMVPQAEPVKDSGTGLFRLLTRDVLGIESVPLSWLLASLLGAAVIVGLASVSAILGVWAERRVSGRMQSRRGPNRVGWFGLVQSLADGIKLMFKEDIIPTNASRVLFGLAPAIVLAGAFAAVAAIPFSKHGILVDMPLGIFLISSLLALSVIGVVMAGWASNNKWSLLGAMREAAQMVSYEIPLGLTILIAVLHFGHLNLRVICEQQAGGFLNIGNWTIFRNPLFGIPAFIVFYIAALANTKRAPFDLPEAESELVSGFHTEYSGIRFSFFFLEEYAAMFIISVVGVCLYLGGWNLPFVPGDWLVGSVAAELVAALVMITKAAFLVFVMIWVRWTLPRIRIDQVMTLGYKYLTPIAFVCLLGTVFWVHAFES
jgi:NADH-quinone oxidoreductase subunit H